MDNIKRDFREIGWYVWTGLRWFRIGTCGGAIVNTVMNLAVQ
jgi:hypothetical protein